MKIKYFFFTINISSQLNKFANGDFRLKFGNKLSDENELLLAIFIDLLLFNKDVPLDSSNFV